MAKSISADIRQSCNQLNLEEKDVLKLVIKYLGLNEEINIKSTDGQLTDFRSRELVWQFWHNCSEESTNTTDIKSIRQTDKPRIQSGLNFASTVTEVIKRNRAYFQSIWKTVVKSYQELHQQFLNENPNNKVSYGTFINLKPFYVHHASAKDLIMCCCKLHLHSRWSISALIACMDKQNITIPCRDYLTFFSFLYENCEAGTSTYLSWNCVCKTDVCDHIAQKWNELKNTVLNSNKEVTVPFTEFKNQAIVNKKGETVKRLTAVKQNVNTHYLVEFISSILPKIIFHRNMLKLYRTVIHDFHQLFDSPVIVDLDFSENLTLDVKFEPQSLHWVKKQITIHSGIVKNNGDKSYHPYVSDTLKHDQVFVKFAIMDMLENTNLANISTIIIESDNCKAQYKSAHHYDDLQEITNMLNKTLIRVFGVAGHGKGEVDHVGGIVKVAVRQEVARGQIFTSAVQVRDFLQSKFGSCEHPNYIINEINEERLTKERKLCQKKNYSTIAGSDLFQILIFKPNASTFKAASRICMCSSCAIEYGSCSIFEEFSLSTQIITIPCLRSHIPPSNTINDLPEDEDETNSFILPNSIVAVAASPSSFDTIWFVHVQEAYVTYGEASQDDYGHIIPPGTFFHTGKFYERCNTTKTGTIYNLSKKMTFFYSESVVFPFVELEERKNGYFLSNSHYSEILCHMEETGFTHL